MITFDNIQVFNFEGAFRGLRNPMNSWGKSDSLFGITQSSNFDSVLIQAEEKGWKDSDNATNWLVSNGIIRNSEDCADAIEYAFIGMSDLILAQKMIAAGSDERKFMRQIMVTVDITAPLFWWKEADTYKVSTVANSCSTMHKIASKPITLEDFSFINDPEFTTWQIQLVSMCESLRQKYNDTKDKRYWRALIELLPESYNQRRTWTANYEVLRNIYIARRNHKLDEWHTFCRMIENLPYGKDLICLEKN